MNPDKTPYLTALLKGKDLTPTKTPPIPLSDIDESFDGRPIDQLTCKVCGIERDRDIRFFRLWNLPEIEEGIPKIFTKISYHTKSDGETKCPRDGNCEKHKNHTHLTFGTCKDCRGDFIGKFRDFIEEKIVPQNDPGYCFKECSKCNCDTSQDYIDMANFYDMREATKKVQFDRQNKTYFFVLCIGCRKDFVSMTHKWINNKAQDRKDSLARYLASRTPSQ